ncbi:N-methylhydantoinase A [Sulfitobacter undariae]|uniref:N-methylhydantoinase A n=1 Tax=Sulfitobacter undariae TaxID=1563671 RepID=A0A7W6E155_9RHOB|nr:hydantoinase/oxoprolinase family protein [Sulfitobacter undariae]MBB3992827.1 N-methylhydantoinase A [Sulfitobacter undariae]
MDRQDARLGVDIGGTFTDVVLETGGDSFSTKVLTTYTAPEQAIIDGMHIVCEKAGLKPRDITQIIHGTTLATNALIERRGAKTALITTEGFRDVIEMRTESRFEQYDLNLKLPEPLLPRQRRYTVPGRIDASGGELLPLTAADIEPVVEAIAIAGYESVAIGLLHSYLNPTHERLVRDVLAARLPDVMISLSCEVSPQMREYERFNTTVANAYIKPLMKSYLGRLEGRLRNEGVNCAIFLMHSGGGIISITNAAEFPVRLVESGPAGGAVFAAHIAARYGLDKVLSFDMGGTTAKICLIQNQTPKTSRVFEVARSYRFKKGSGMPISIPVIDMVEIGAGGGSIAHVDALRQIRVGPESAGSEPGPACYGRGGTRPTVTDANLVVGKLDAKKFAGGTMTLDENAARAAVLADLGDPLDLDVKTAASGLVEVVDENMANAARVHAVENGEDLSEYTMIAFGGAAPLHAGRLCEKLGITRLLIPEGAGVGSAIGFLRAPFSFEATRSVYMTLARFDRPTVTDLLAELRAEATSFVRTCAPKGEIIAEYKVYMRYKGQGWEIPVSLTAEQVQNPDPAVFEERFTADYTRLFGRAVVGMDIEITVWSVNATTPPQPVNRAVQQTRGKVAVVNGKCSFFDAAKGENVHGYLYRRHRLVTGTEISGPACITEDETTIIIPSSRRAHRQPDGCIDVTLKNKG